MDQNPYRAPVDVEFEQTQSKGRTIIGRAGSGRFLAAQIDHTLAVVLFLVVGMNVAPAVGNITAGLAALATYSGFYFVPEWLFGTSVGKAIFALRVRDISGRPCTAKQIAVRTLWRFLEVNPLLLGALPAGIAILTSSRRQRIGDWFANTVVVRRDD